MLYCPECGHHHRRHDGQPSPCQGLIYSQDDDVGVHRCQCHHHNQT